MNLRTCFTVIGVALAALAPGDVLAREASEAAPEHPSAAARPGAAPEPISRPATTSDATASPGGGLGGVTDRVLPERAPLVIEGIDPSPGGLTADEVARRALAASASVKEKRAEVSAANERITQTMMRFFPHLTVTAGYTRLSKAAANFGGGALVGAANAGTLGTGPCAPGATTLCVVDSAGAPVSARPFAIPSIQDQYSLGARLSVPLSDYVLRLNDASVSSRSSREAAQLAVAAERLRVKADARTLYFNWLRARAQTAIARKAALRTHARLVDARTSFEVGLISKADLLRIEALVANTELVQDRTESLLSLTVGQLAIVMEDWHPDYRVGEGVPEPDRIAAPDATVDRLIAEAGARRLEAHAADATVRAFQRGAGASRAGALPRVDGVGDVTYANPNQRYFPQAQEWNGSWSAGVQASWTIDEAFTSSAAARELEANAAAAIARRTALRAGIANEVLIAHLDLARARSALDKHRVALAAAEEAYRVTADLFRAGRATSTDLVDSEVSLLEAKLGDVNVRIDLAVASIALRHATGRDVPERGDGVAAR